MHYPTNRIHTRDPFFHDGRAQLEFPSLKTDLLLWQKYLQKIYIIIIIIPH